jgi:2-ketoarginine methyltransferase
MNQTTTFLSGLSKSLDYIRGYVASQVLFDLLRDGVLDDLATASTASAVARRQQVDPELLGAVFEYLTLEDILEKRTNGGVEPEFVLTEYGQSLRQYKGWFNMLVGGYGSIFGSIGTMLKHGTGAASRTGKWVGVGSCQISHYDAIPLARQLIHATRPDASMFVDFGCGNALYLCTFCREMEGIRAVGIEPDPASYEAGLEMVKREGMVDRITLVNCSALEYAIAEPPDFMMFNFVLHEIYGQVGEQGMIDFVRTIGRTFPDTLLLVVDVDYAVDNHAVMKTPVGLGYYNPYYLLHPFTRQKLVPEKQWDALFARAGFRTVAKRTVDPDVDPTGLEIGWVLESVNGGRRSGCL